LGQTWSGPFQINKVPSKTAIFPWSSAGSNGALDVVWYGTNYFDGVNPPDSYPMTASWKVYFSQNLRATTTGRSWSHVAACGTLPTISTASTRTLQSRRGARASSSRQPPPLLLRHPAPYRDQFWQEETA